MVTVALDPPLGALGTVALSAIHGRSRIRFSRKYPDRADYERLAAEVVAGRVRPTICRRYSLADAPAAYRDAMKGGVRGKILIEVVRS